MYFSPNTAITTPITIKNNTTLENSPLSGMFINAETELLNDSIDREGTPNLYMSLSNDDVESEYDKDEIYDLNDPSSSSKITEEDIAFSKAFMSMDLNDLDKFEASMNTALGELFLLLVNLMNLQFTLKIKIMNLM